MTWDLSIGTLSRHLFPPALYPSALSCVLSFSLTQANPAIRDDGVRLSGRVEPCAPGLECPAHGECRWRHHTGPRDHNLGILLDGCAAGERLSGLCLMRAGLRQSLT